MMNMLQFESIEFHKQKHVGLIKVRYSFGLRSDVLQFLN